MLKRKEKIRKRLKSGNHEEENTNNQNKKNIYIEAKEVQK